MLITSTANILLKVNKSYSEKISPLWVAKYGRSLHRREDIPEFVQNKTTKFSSREYNKVVHLCIRLLTFSLLIHPTAVQE